MLVHEAALPETVVAFEQSPATAKIYAPPAFTAFEDRLEDAVDQACIPLIGTVPRADRLQRHGALRQELNTLVVAHLELAPVPEQAVEEAIAYFARLHPAPALRAAPIAQTSVRQTTAQRASTRPATLLALGLLLPTYLAIVYGGMQRLMHNPVGDAGTNLYRMELFAVPLLAGLVVGLLAQNRAARGVFNACLVLAAWAVLLPSVIVGLTYTHLLPFEQNAFWERVCANPLAGYVGLVFWPVIGCAGATLGAKLRRKARYCSRQEEAQA